MPSVRAPLVAIVILGVVAPVASAAPVPPDSPREILPHEGVEDPDGNVTVFRGDGARFESMTDATALHRSRADEDLRPADFLVPGDLLALRFRSGRLNATVAATGGANATDRFFAALNTTASTFSVEGRSHGTGQLAAELQLNRTNTKVVREPANATFWVLVDTAEVRLVARSDHEPVRRDLDHLEFAALVEIPTDGDARVLAGSSSFRPADVELRSPDAGAHLASAPATVTAEAATGLTVNGTTPVLPGTELAIRAVAPDGTVLATDRVRTRERSQSSDRYGPSGFETTLAVGRLDDAAAFDLVVTREGEPLAERRVVVGEAPRMWNTTARVVESGTHEGEIAVEATVRVPDDGFLVVYDDGEPVSAPIPADRQARARLYVDRSAVDEDGDVYVLAVWDADGDGEHDRNPDRLFRTTANVGASAQDDELDALVPVDGWQPPTPTATATPSPTASPTPSPTATPSPTPTTTPGFGWLAAVVGGAVAVLLRWTRG